MDSFSKSGKKAERGPALIIMAKAPLAGQVKSRLCPPLVPLQAAGLAAALLKDAFHKAHTLSAALLFAYTPAEERTALEAMLPDAEEWLLQSGADLGEKMENALKEACAAGYSPLVLIGTDVPSLPFTTVNDAFAVLHSSQADVVFLPVEDGGFCLLGASRPVPGLFEKVAWSSSSALSDTLENGRRLGLRIRLLPAWYDIDTPADLQRLSAELDSDPLMCGLAPNTCLWLKENRETLDCHTHPE